MNIEENYLKKELYDLVKKDSSVFEFIQSGSLDGIWYWDLEKPENEWMSPRFWENFGYDPKTKKHLASEWQDLINPDDLKVAIYNFTKHCKDPNHPYDQIVRYKKGDGSTAWVRCRGLAVRDKDGKAIRFLGAHTDVTQLKLKEQELEEVNQRNGALLLSIGEGVIAVDETNKITLINKAAEEMIGWKAMEIIGRLFFDLITIVDDKGEILPREQRPMDLALTGKTTTTTNTGPTYNYVRKNKTTFPVAIKVTPIYSNEKIIGAVCVFRDISREREIDKEKTEFVSLASHQLKTPVGAISWNLEMLLSNDYGKIPEKQKKLLKETYNMNLRMNELINALLNVARIESGVFIIEPVPTNLQLLCEEVLTEMGSNLDKKGHKLKRDFSTNLPQIPADQKLLRIIFQNFISNAIKYTHDGGQITVSLKTDAENIVFSVANDGDPIPEVDQSKIFTKMFRASNAQEQDSDGSGLGLYVAKMIAESSGGHIWFTSKSGEDTVFSCALPLTGMMAKVGTKQLS